MNKKKLIRNCHRKKMVIKLCILKFVLVAIFAGSILILVTNGNPVHADPRGINLIAENLFCNINKTRITDTDYTKIKINLNKEIRGSILATNAPSDGYIRLRYDLLTTVIYDGVQINPDGSLSDYLDKALPYIEYAHAKGVKVVLMFTVEDPNNPNGTDVILGDPVVRFKVIQNLLSDVINNGFDGVSDDMENINGINTVTSTPNRDLLTTFHAELANTFRTKNPNYDISIWIGEVNWNNLYDVNTLKNYVNYFQIMAYGFGRGGIGTPAGPWTPIKDSSILPPIPQGIAPMLTYWYDLGLPRNQTLLGISYEGEEWPTMDNNRLSNITGVANWIKYGDFQNNILQYQRIWDTEWQTPWYVRQDNNGQWYQAFIDDVQSYGIKYDLINLQELAGIAIWSADEGIDRNELWDLIQNKFTNLTFRCQHHRTETSLHSQYKTMRMVCRP